MTSRFWWLPLTVALSACPSDPTEVQISLTLDQTNALADGVDAINVVATVTDSQGAVHREHLRPLVSGQGATVTPEDCETDVTGACAFAVRSTVAGQRRVSILRDDDSQESRSVTFRPPMVSLALTTVTVTPDHLPANGIATAEIVVTVLNELGTPYEGVEVSVHYSPLATPTPSLTPTGADGTARFTISGTTPTSSQLIIIVGGAQLDQTPLLVFEPVNWPIAGSIEGLSTDGLILECTGQADLELAAGTTRFSFMPGLVTNQVFHVGVKQQPRDAWCEVSNGDGLVYAGINGVRVTCRSAWTQVAAGDRHVLGLRADHTLWAWGDGSQGQLGAPGNPDGGALVQVPGQWRWIAASHQTSFGIQLDGSLWAWGSADRGQLGPNPPLEAGARVQIPGTWRVVAVGDQQVLAIADDGSLWSWGSADDGSLGRDRDGGLEPEQLAAGPYVQLAAAADSFALASDGGLDCFGPNWLGGLGVGDLAPRLVPTRLDGSWQAIATGSGGTLGVRSDGSLWGWGSNLTSVLGDGGLVTTPQPLGVDALSMAIDGVGLWVLPDGGLGGAGLNDEGQLGQGDRRARFPGAVLDAPGVIRSVTTRGGASYVVTTQGTLFAFGAEARLDAKPFTEKPLLLDGTWSLAATGPGHSLAIARAQALWGWGDGSQHLLGPTVTAQQASPLLIDTDIVTVARAGSGYSLVQRLGSFFLYTDAGVRTFATDTVDVAVGEAFTARLIAGNRLVTQGENDAGQLGVGDTGVHGASTLDGGWRAVAAGRAHVLALSLDGGLYAWGANESGQLGLGGFASFPRPTRVSGVTGLVTQVAATGSSSFALTADGTLWAWGSGRAGELPFATPMVVTQPRSAGLTGLIALAVGPHHGLALKTDGTVWSWGTNDFGQRGFSGADAGWAPAQLPGRYGAIAVGGKHSLCVRSDQRLVGFGLNEEGALGVPALPASPQLTPWRIP